MPVFLFLVLTQSSVSQFILQKLFGFLLEYIGDLATNDPPDLKIIDKLIV
jgi:hypothetical protein